MLTKMIILMLQESFDMKESCEKEVMPMEIRAMRAS